MKVGDYITKDDWKALGRKNQLALRDGLRFVGHLTTAKWFPDEEIDRYSCVYLYPDGDICILHVVLIDEEDRRISLSEVLSFIELTSFQANE